MARNKVVNLTIKLRDGVSTGLRKIGRGIGGLVKRMLSLKTAVLGLAGAGGAFALLAKSIKTSFNFETMRTQLRVLLGSVEEAAKQFKILRDFSAKTPFQIEGIMDAYQQLLTFTEGALATEEGLKLVGDAAAGRGKDFAEVAYWTGRLYSALKNGDPFMDSVSAMQRMGIAGGTIRGDLEKLTKSGADFGTKWAVVEKSLLRFTGGMDLLSKTGDGLFSTLKDNWTIALATFGDEFQKAAKDGIIFMTKKIQQLVKDGSITEWAKQAKSAFDSVVDTVKVLTSAKSSKDRTDLLGAAAHVLKAAFVDAADAMVAILSYAAPKIGSAIADGFKRVISRTKERREIRHDLAREGKLPLVESLFGSRKTMQKQKRLIDEEMARRGKAREESSFSALMEGLSGSDKRLPMALKEFKRVARSGAARTENRGTISVPDGRGGWTTPAAISGGGTQQPSAQRGGTVQIPDGRGGWTTPGDVGGFSALHDMLQPGGNGSIMPSMTGGAMPSPTQGAGGISEGVGSGVQRTNELLQAQNEILEARLGGVE